MSHNKMRHFLLKYLHLHEALITWSLSPGVTLAHAVQGGVGARAGAAGANLRAAVGLNINRGQFVNALVHMFLSQFRSTQEQRTLHLFHIIT